MARKLPLSAAPPEDFDAAGIEATLARLPDAWTLIHDRRIGGAGGPHVAWVLLHPEIGVALIDLAPTAPQRAVAALRALIDPADRALAGVPIVALAVAPDAGAALGQQLADAFAAAPPCRTTDPDWTDRIEGLLLNAEDAAMAPLGDPPPRPEPAWRPRIAPDDAILPPPPAQRQPPARRLPFAAAVAFLAVAVLAVTYLLARGPVADSSVVAVRMPIEAPTAASAKRADTMPMPTPMPTARTIATPSAPLAPKAPPPLPPANPVAAPPAENAAASPPQLPAPKPVVARAPVRHARPRRTALARAPRDLAPARAMSAPLPPAASGPPIDADDLPPLPTPAPVQQAANRPVDAPMPPTPHGGALASGQPMMLLPPIGPPAAMPPPPSSGPGAGAIVGGPP